MKQKITAHKKIEEIRKNFSNSAHDIISMLTILAEITYVTSGSKYLMEQREKIVKLCNKVEVDLTDAQRSIMILLGKWNLPSSNTQPYKNVSQKKKYTIEIDIEMANRVLEILVSERTGLDNAYKNVCAAYNEIENLETNNLAVSILTVIEALTPLPPVTSSALVIRRNALRNLKDVKTNLSKISSFIGGSNYVNSSSGAGNIVVTVQNSLQKFIASENEARRAPYQSTLDVSSSLNKESSTEEINDTRQKLEKCQEKYVGFYGEKCPEIEEEIARLNELYAEKGITYEAHIPPFNPCSRDMKDEYYENGALCQRNYSQFNTGNGNDGCYCVAYALALNMLGEDVSPIDVKCEGASHECSWRNVNGKGIKTEYSSSREFSVDSKECLMDIYNALKEGRPSVLQVPGHLVTIVGIDAGIPYDNLTLSDFICLDPYDGREKKCSDVFSYYGYCSYIGVMG